MLIREIFPELARELELLLRQQGELDLASQISTLAIVDRCRCGDAFCSSFYTQPKPQGHYGHDYRSIDLDATTGMIILDVVAGLIAQVELLNREDIRRPLISAIP